MTEEKDQDEQKEAKPQGNSADAEAADAPEAPKASAKTRQPLSAREKVLAGVAAIAVVAAVGGFGLYASAVVPESAAAKVNDTYIEESDVASWIAQYRSANSLADDAAFASAIADQNLNPSSFRETAVNQIALSELLSQRAEQLGKTPTEEEAAAQLDATRQNLSLGDDDSWAQMLESYSLTEEGLKEQYKANLAKEAVLEADVPRREATDEELLSYAKDYLAGTTQKHAYRIVFSGEDASERASQCMEKLRALRESGELDLASFKALAEEYSDEEGFEETEGSYSWSGAGMSDVAKEALEYAQVGDYAGPEDIDGSKVILFCDEEYAFPKKSDFESLPSDVPDELMDEIRDAASENLWSSDCNSYLAWVLSQAKITYYPIPTDATYNVDMSLANGSAQDGGKGGANE